jgi:orotidine-5'-phosphate decarboxylase
VPDFGSRLSRVLDTRGPLCVGIDAHPFLLDAWGLSDSASGAREFGLTVVDAAAHAVGVVKPQVAFFERFGSAGYTALEAVISAARDAGLLVIADVKRGDIGSTVDAYAAAWLSPGSPLESDAMTVVAYQGVGSLRGPIELARANEKGLFVLAATSNPEARATQTAQRPDGGTVAAGVVSEIAEYNPGPGLGSIGVVIGATVDMDDYRIDRASLARTPILAPGFGEQGAELAELGSVYGSVSAHVIANVGRSVLRGGSSALAESIRRAAESARSAR